jgi:hypothetical protein
MNDSRSLMFIPGLKEKLSELNKKLPSLKNKAGS